MANVAISGDTSGAITLTVPAIAGTRTVTFPAATGNVMVDGNMPAFAAYSTNNSQTVANSTETTIIFQNSVFDTASCYNTSNGIFTPTVAGYYQINVSVIFYDALTAGEHYWYVAKNNSGAAPLQMGADTFCISTGVYGFSGAFLVQANGTTDNFRVKVAQATGGTKALSNNTRFNGYLVRTT